uniref:Mas-related G protein-coupled receptor G1 n=1 Tax=Otolemur garnettii TaxID=30611 RepID=W8W3J5_OTOGA|nr:TPA: Mas-related G protein-coupled receptor G1 [Otolemur garnettii]
MVLPTCQVGPHNQRSDHSFPMSFCVLRGTSGAFVSMDPTTPAWSAEPTSNRSYEPHSLPCVSQYPIPTWLTLIIALVGLPGNTVVLWLLGFCISRNAFSVYILNLAMADFLYLWGCFSFALMELINKPNLIAILDPVLMFLYFTGLSILGAVSTERYLSVLWPIWYRCHRPRHTSAVVCALLWTLSLLLITLVSCICAFIRKIGDHDFCKTFQFFVSTCLMVLFVILCGSSLALLTRFLCGSRGMRVTRLYLTILLTVLVFLICTLPCGIYWLLLYWFIKVTKVFPCYTGTLVISLSCVNSSTNPLIYFFVGYFRQQRQRKQQTLKRVLQRALQDTPEGDDCGDSLPQETLELSESRQVQ